MRDRIYDLAVIGAGINGAGIAADAAGRGLQVVLIEMGDIAGATSSASSKLIHGGLRYLEHHQFGLVRKALKERENLLAKAPHIVWPLRFVLPLVPGMRPAWMIRAGLFLYDHLARREKIPGSSGLDLGSDPAGRPLQPHLDRGFCYWDCWVDDARLVVLNARAAADKGATVMTRTKASDVRAEAGLWNITLRDGSGSAQPIAARVLVDATGPWAGQLTARHPVGDEGPPRKRLRLVKGSHIVVPRIAGAEDAYLLQSRDGRIVFALPFEQRFTLIGTTDTPYVGDPAAVAIDTGEETYLLELANQFFRSPISRGQIVWRYSGVRPLQDDGDANPSSVSRDWKLELEAGQNRPPLLTVIGGKVTTFRTLAEAALEILAPHLPAMGPAWTATAPLPGGDVGAAGIAGYLDDLALHRPGFGRSTLGQLVRRYGTHSDTVLGDARTERDLGEQLGAGLSAREVDYLKTQEWAQQPDDVLWRRTKVGLHLDVEQRQRASERLAAIL